GGAVAEGAGAPGGRPPWPARASPTVSCGRWVASATRSPLRFPMSLAHTEAVSSALERARQEARALGHDHLGTEHVLLGLVGEETSMAGILLGRLGVALPRLRLEVGRVLTPLPEEIKSRPL